MKHTVTIAMPVYNVAPYVEKSLLSALNQTFADIEYLLVDDRGTDESMERMCGLLIKNITKVLRQPVM